MSSTDAAAAPERLPASAEVVVVGAGLAGLSAAIRLSAAGCDVHLVEADTRPGGRLATEVVDGFVVDRGFQVLNTGYPRMADLDLDALELGWFLTGARIRSDAGTARVIDPRSRPTALVPTATAPIGTLREKAALVAFSLRAGYLPVDRLLRSPERSAEEALRRAGAGGAVLERFLRPFLAGVLLEDELATSSRYLELLWRSFVRGRIGLPTRGMQSVGEQLADRLDLGRLHLGQRVTAVSPGSVGTESGLISADAVVVATDPSTAAGLLPAVEAYARREVTTHLHVLPASPWHEALLVLGRPGGRVVNSAVLSDAQPRYSPDDRALLASSTLAPTREADVREEIARLHGGGDHRSGTAHDGHRDRRPAGCSPPAAAAPPGRPRRRPVRLRRPPRHPVDPRRHGQRCPSCPGRAAPAAPRRPRRTRLMPAAAPTILATSMGFSGHNRGPYDWRPGPVFDLAFALAGGPAQPRLCYLGTATGDDPVRVAGVYGAFAGSAVRVSHLSLFPMPTVADVRAHLLAQDVVWVGGGSVANLLAVWRVHGLEEVFREAWQAGVVLAGVSAGSLCWHVGGTTDSFGPDLRPVRNGLALLPHSNGVHYDSEEQRRPLYHRLVGEGTLPAGYATDDGVGLVYRGTDLVEAVADRPGKAAYHVLRNPDGGVTETRVEPRRLH